MSDYFNLKNGFKENSSFPKKLKNPIPKINSRLLIIIIVALIGLPVTLILSRQEQDTRQFASENENKNRQSQGYIIEFKEPGLAQREKRARSALVLNQERTQLRNSNRIARQDILKVLGKSRFVTAKERGSDVEVYGDFENVINGIALNISKQEAEKIKKGSSYVANIYPNLVTETQLMNSVPMIGADKVWAQKDSKGSFIKGEGVNIAILDTGIDYTHQDLGATQIEERQFTKINDIPLYMTDRATNYRDQFFSMNNNRLVYLGYTKFIVKDLETNRVIEAVPYLAGSQDGMRIIMKDNLIAYILFDPYPNDQSPSLASLYFYDLSTKEHRKIMSLRGFGFLGISGRHIIVSGQIAVDGPLGVFDYDLDSDTYQSIDHLTVSKVQDMNILVDGDWVYQKPTGEGDPCSSGINVYNLKTQETKDIAPNQIYSPISVEGNKLVYQGCDWVYYLYDLITGSTKKLTLEDLGSFNPQLYYLERGGHGAISGNLIYTTEGVSYKRIALFDLDRNKYVKINLVTSSNYFAAEGNRICFVTDTAEILCHVYDPSYSYPTATNIYNNKVVNGHDFVYLDGDPIDDNGHGTHVSGIVGGKGVLNGVAPEANLYAYKVLTSNGKGTSAQIIAAIDKAIETRLDPNLADISILNISIGAFCGSYYDSECGPDDVLSKAVDRASSYGILSVVAAGNAGPDSSSITSPGTARTALTVGSVSLSKSISDFSSRGPITLPDEVVQKPDIVAPGEGICSSKYPGSLGGTCQDNTHVSNSGTSMAAPHVAGLAALILQAHPDWTPQQVKDSIKNSADNLGYDYNVQGSGLVNAQKIFAILPTPTLTIVPTPTLTQIPTPTPIPTVALKKLTRNPSADSYVRSDQPSKNYGTATILQADSSPNTITYMKYNLTPLAGKTIVSAKLILKVSNTSSISNSLRRAEDKSWTETGLKFSNRPSFVSTIRTFTPNKSTIELDVKSAVNAKKGGTLTLGITSSRNAITRFYSRESASSNRPQLVVEYR